MIKLISKFSMIPNAKFPDLNLGVYMRVRKKRTNQFFQCCLQQMHAVESNDKVFLHKDIKMMKE